MTTPMLKQYFSIKEQNKECILFFRLGDFYEMFGDDAVTAAQILNITLTARNKGSENETPMCGIPYHAAEGYVAKLTRAGKKVAICEQNSNPDGKGIVTREVVRIVTPGTTFDDNVLSSKIANNLVSIDYQEGSYGLSVIDVTTGKWRTTQHNEHEIIIEELSRLEPAEVIYSRHYAKKNEPTSIPHPYAREHTPSGYKSDDEILSNFLSIKSVDSIGLSTYSAATGACALVLDFLSETQKSSLEHLPKPKFYALDETVILDQTTIRNLELFYNSSDGSSKGALISTIDRTVTGMGGRLLRYYLSYPLLNKTSIQKRLDSVSAFVNNPSVREKTRELLKKCSDTERLLGKIGSQRCNARDLLALRETLERVPLIRDTLKAETELTQLTENLTPPPELINLLSKGIADDPITTLTEGGMIRDGFNSELDELREVAFKGKDFIARMQAREIERTGISSLKIKYNKVFGYYIEVSKANISQAPSDYERKQTLVNAERFITPELKEYEEKVLTAQSRIFELEYILFVEIRNFVTSHLTYLRELSSSLATLDVYSSLAELAVYNNYCVPKLHDGYELEIIDGRHPVIESLQEEPYIPNDCLFNESDHQLILLTGPNMSGKSSYLRQIAHIVLLAQIGSYVPASEAMIGIVDRVFTRVGASDNLSKGQSTFMMEMQEAANILHSATKKSLVIFDELGRGTSTFDGLSIAWAIIEHIHNTVGAKTLFATHYHELIELAEALDYAKNYSVSVQQEADRVIFLRRVVPGAISQSYGIEVAKLAGLPKSVISRAYEMLKTLESGEAVEHSHTSSAPSQIKLLDECDEFKEKIQSLLLDEITPLQALQLLKILQDEL